MKSALCHLALVEFAMALTEDTPEVISANYPLQHLPTYSRSILGAAPVIHCGSLQRCKIAGFRGAVLELPQEFSCDIMAIATSRQEEDVIGIRDGVGIGPRRKISPRPGKFSLLQDSSLTL